MLEVFLVGGQRHEGLKVPQANPTQRDTFDEEADELERMAPGFRRRNQEMLDALLDDAKGYRDALHMANPTDPWITVLLCICLAQQRTIADAGLIDEDQGNKPE